MLLPQTIPQAAVHFRREQIVKGVGRLSGEFLEFANQILLSCSAPLFKPRDLDFGFVALSPYQPERYDGSALRSMVEQALIDVTNISHIKFTKRELARFGTMLMKNLQRFEGVENCAVVHRQRSGRCIVPRCSLRPAFEETETVRIEELASVSRQRKPIVAESGMYSAEGGKKAAPGIDRSRILKTYDKLGIPLREREALLGVQRPAGDEARVRAAAATAASRSMRYSIRFRSRPRSRRSLPRPASCSCRSRRRCGSIPTW